MLDYNEIKPKRFIIWNGEPCEVLDSHIFRKQQRKPVNQVKLKNLISGKVVETSFHQSEKVEEADLDKKIIIFIYSRGNEYWFHTAGDKSDRFSLSSDILGSQANFLKNGMEIDALIFNEKIIGVKFPIKMELEVTEAPPSVKGNTAQGGDKRVVVETGASVTAPLFINEGDIIRVNTETAEYVERVEKK